MHIHTFSLLSSPLTHTPPNPPPKKRQLGEQVITALLRMKCPAVIQSHQIQGLDFQSLFPVFQWLVKQVIATREERAGQIRHFSELQFHHSHVAPEDMQAEAGKKVGWDERGGGGKKIF